MSVSTIYATYSGRWDHFGGGAFYSWIAQSSSGGQNGGIGGLKLNHNKPGSGDSDDFGDCGKGFVQFDTSSIPANATISEAKINVQYTKNNFAFGGVGFARSTMAVGNVYNDALDEHLRENIITGNDKPNSGIVDFFLANPNVVVTKAGWSKYHVGTSHSLTMISPGPAAPGGADDFNMSGVDAYGTNRPKIVITWTTPPAVSNGGASSIEHNSAVLAGNVTDVGGGTVSERGVCWGLSLNPTIANPRAASSGQGGAFTVNATGLTKNTTYHMRPYVITENSIQYGPDSVFTTDVEPTVVSVSITGLNVNQAIANGNVTSDGRGTVSERGFVLNKVGTPTIADTKIAYVSGGTGTYDITFPNLIPGTKYFVRPYAINGAGLSYGDEMNFITPGSALFMMMA